MAELVDALGSGPSVLTVIGVQVSSRVFANSLHQRELDLLKVFRDNRLSAILNNGASTL